jgi:GNAT superfamily N-acetyltransferase
MQVEIRRPHTDEHERVRSLVSEVVNETYGGIWPTTPITVSEEDWGAGWIAASAGDLLEWMLTQDCWFEDLWIASRFRGRGVGSALLQHGEKEIAARGIATAKLQVIASNHRAIAFYEKRGWRPVRETPHEVALARRLEMTKAIG